MIKGAIISSPGEITDKDLYIIRAGGNSAINPLFGATLSRLRQIKKAIIPMVIFDISDATPVDYANRNADPQCKLAKKIFSDAAPHASCIAFYNYHGDETQNNAQRKIEFFTTFIEDTFKNIPHFMLISDTNMDDIKGNLEVAISKCETKNIIAWYDKQENWETFERYEKTGKLPPSAGSHGGAQTLFYAYQGGLYSLWSPGYLNALLKINGTDYEIKPGESNPWSPENPDSSEKSGELLTKMDSLIVETRKIGGILSEILSKIESSIEV